MTPELRTAFGNAYNVFSRYEDPLNCARISGVTRPLHLMTRQDLNRMNGHFDMPVLLCDSTTYLHFLSRILEWIYEANASEFDNWGLWNLTYHLSKNGWLQWPAEEIEALRSVFGWWTHEVLLH